MPIIDRLASVTWRARTAELVAGLAAAATLAGCSQGAASSGGPAAAASSRPMPSSSSTPAAAPVPVLGRPAGLFAHGTGWGKVKPTEVFNGGDPTGLVTHITWSSWGGIAATGTGTSDYVGPNQSVASGTEEGVTIVAFDVGTCGGTFMYRAVEWFYPQHGGSFNPNQYEDVCTGSYVGQ